MKQELIRCGKILFAEKGYKHTKVKDVTDLADISVGTFYNYFDSKEELFLEVYLKKHDEAKKELLNLFDKKDEPLEIIKKAVYKFLNIMQSDPILRVFFNPNLHEKYRENLDLQRKQKQFDYAYDMFAPMLKGWQEKGKINDEIQVNILLATLDSIFYILIHKQDIGEHNFPDIIDFLIDSILCKLRP